MKTKHQYAMPARKLSVAISTLLLAAGQSALAQQNATVQAPPAAPADAIEEVVVLGRLRDSAQMLMMERISQPYAAEVIGLEQITRAGDPDVALALRRVTGLTLVDNKFIYVRGLGERYSSATLNGAEIPSPELSRNVIPLDLFPSSILESVKVSKAYSADQPAAFGGGNVNIRTRSVPDGPLFQVSAGTGWNTENSNEGLNNLGDQGELPQQVRAAIDTYQGDITPVNITRFQNPGVGIPSAQMQAAGRAANRDLMLSLNRDIELQRESSLNPNLNASVTAGNSWDLNNDFNVGALAALSYGTNLRNQNQREKNFAAPERDQTDVLRTFESENLTAALNFQADYQGKHTVSTNSYLLRNHEDQAAIVEQFNADFQQSEGRQRRTYVSRLEQRDLVAHQVIGKHNFERGDFGFVRIPGPFTEVNVNWFYSDATATTTIPNASSVQATNFLDPANNNALLLTQINVGTSTQFTFLDLEDNVESTGFQVDLPFEWDLWTGTLSGGGTRSRKTRDYIGWTANLYSGPNAPRAGTPGEVFSDAAISNPDNDFYMLMGSNFGTESYLAAEIKNAGFGSADITWDDKWRLSAGVRWEDFSRGVLPMNLLDYSGNSILSLINNLQQPNQTYAVNESDYFPAVALTYMRDGFLNAETFQVRLGYGKTVVRPDLREFADVQFIDPELNNRVQGNPNLIFSEIDHLDLRTEMYFDNGDNLTVSLFYKDIANPIERVQRPGPQDARLLSFENAVSGEIYGIEFEGLKNLPYGLFLSGNLVLSDSELVFPQNTAQTSQTRRLTGHSKYVVNTQLGFDSEDGQHALSLLYNVFGDRVFFGGLFPAPDSFEQPFHSVDMTYSYYPTDQITVRLRAQNLLNDTRTFEQGGVQTIEVDVGVGLRADVQWQF
ncbi:MAG: TonB-dependent receptor domain-containing protein [Pseudohongiellaceae bacterium]